MKFILAFLLTGAVTNCFSQTAAPVQYKDTVNHFSINIPAGWRYGVSKNAPTIKLIALRSPDDTLNKAHENFNLNILEKANSSTDREYDKLIGALSSTNDFVLVEKGTITIHQQPYKWFVETHKNNGSGAPMHNYVFITYKDGKTYILTFVAFSTYFEQCRSLFLDIAETFTL
jgi:hypothetical protein